MQPAAWCGQQVRGSVKGDVHSPWGARVVPPEVVFVWLCSVVWVGKESKFRTSNGFDPTSHMFAHCCEQLHV